MGKRHDYRVLADMLGVDSSVLEGMSKRAKDRTLGDALVKSWEKQIDEIYRLNGIIQKQNYIIKDLLLKRISPSVN